MTEDQLGQVAIPGKVRVQGVQKMPHQVGRDPEVLERATGKLKIDQYFPLSNKS